MAWNPLEHLDKMVISNALTASPWPDPWPSSTTLPSGQLVPAAAFGRPESVAFWLSDGGVYQPITREQAFVQKMWLHFAYGAPAPADELQDVELVAAGLAREYSITVAAMREAVLSLPHVLETIADGGYTEADVWGYTQHEAPWAVDLVGVAPA